MRPKVTSLCAVLLLICCGSCAADRDFLNCLNECVSAESWTSCMKHRVLGYLDDRLRITTEARSLETVDEAIVARTIKYLKSFDYGIDLPFVDANLKYRPSRSLADLDVEFKNNQAATSQARGLLKKKLLLPFLLLLKLKLKALMPIFVAIVGIKALKALVLSKLALLIVIGFVALQFFKKGGMMMPMGTYAERRSAPRSSPIILSVGRHQTSPDFGEQFQYSASSFSLDEFFRVRVITRYRLLRLAPDVLKFHSRNAYH